ncbi:ROK family transcriptional regulator [Endozoicomonas ascidiicola]|uniref:ROK family transcriptional regulator n=1 Tax=Endozoicomonas ascidiicola TaxID=1698521 RepID=UPI0008313F4E|nr:ROK family transcriptional regulator [Endozoicomonas ascidiicola]
MRVEPLTLSTNQKMILDLIRRNDQITRSEISKLSGLTAGAITQNCKELSYLGLIREGEKNKGHRGQPSLPLLINEKGAIAVGISFSMGFIDLTVLNLKGESIVTTRQPHDEAQPFSKTLEQVQQLIELTLKSNFLNHARMIGVGYSVSGFMMDGIHRHCVEPLKHWRTLNLETEFQKNVDAPTWVENNVNAAALGEFYSGQWNKASSMAFIEMGHGFGGGVIIDSKLMPGFSRNAGEIGGFSPTGIRPSFTSLNNELHKQGLTIDPINADHPAVNQWLTNIRDTVSLATLSCINWIDPEVIVFGGKMPKDILGKVVDSFKEDYAREFEAYPTSRAPEIVVSEFGEAISAKGAAMLPIYHTLWLK